MLFTPSYAKLDKHACSILESLNALGKKLHFPQNIIDEFRDNFVSADEYITKKYGRKIDYSFLSISEKFIDKIDRVKNNKSAISFLYLLADDFWNRCEDFSGGKKDFVLFIEQFENLNKDLLKVSKEIDRMNNDYLAASNSIVEIGKALKTKEDKIASEKNELIKAQLHAEYEGLKKQATQKYHDYTSCTDEIQIRYRIIEVSIKQYKDLNNQTNLRYEDFIEKAKEQIQFEQEKKEISAKSEQTFEELYGTYDGIVGKANADIESDASLQKGELQSDLKDALSQIKKEIIDEIVINREENSKNFNDMRCRLGQIHKLAKEDLLKKLTDLYKCAPEQEPAANEALPLISEISNRKLSTKDIIHSLLELDPPNTIGAAANMRALIDAYCKYEHGIELHKEQHLMFYRNDKDKLMTDKISLFKHVFKEDAQSVLVISQKCNETIHYSVKALNEINETKGAFLQYSKELIDKLGMSFEKLNLVNGTKKLYKHEFNSLKKILDCEFSIKEISSENLRKLLTKNDNETLDQEEARIKGANTQLSYAKKRLNDYAEFLRSAGVEESFFDGLQELLDATYVPKEEPSDESN